MTLLCYAREISRSRYKCRYFTLISKAAIWKLRPNARFTQPVFTGVKTYTREHGPCSRVPVHTGRVHGPWTRPVNTGCVNRALSWVPLSKCLHGSAPSYLTELCILVATNTGRRYLRSASRGDLLVLRTKAITYGPRSFAVSGPSVWNDLPSTLHATSTTLGQFQSGLKKTLFRLAYGTWFGAAVTV